MGFSQNPNRIYIGSPDLLVQLRVGSGFKTLSETFNHQLYRNQTNTLQKNQQRNETKNTIHIQKTILMQAKYILIYQKIYNKNQIYILFIALITVFYFNLFLPYSFYYILIWLYTNNWIYRFDHKSESDMKTQWKYFTKLKNNNRTAFRYYRYLINWYKFI